MIHSERLLYSDTIYFYNYKIITMFVRLIHSNKDPNVYMQL